MTMRSLKQFTLAMGVALLLPACQSVQTTQAGAVGIERSQRMAASISAADVERAAAAQYAELMAEAARKGRLDRQPAQVTRVQGIARRLVREVPVFRADAARWAWEVHVLTDDEVNAWCMPGGKIAVYTGLIDKIQPTDAELAAVIGHEIAHALREHARERASEQRMAALGISLASAALGLGNLGQQGMEYAYMGLLGLPNSRLHETEADRMGVELAARAGYDPQAAVSLWRKMAAQGGGAPIPFLSTHPAQKDRMADLAVYAERVAPLYREAQGRR